MNKEDANEVDYEFGKDWVGWDYKKRVQDATKVQAKLVSENAKNTQLTTKLNNMRKLCRKLKCRQKEIPLVGPYIDLAKAEPLHMKNNVCKEMFCDILAACLSVGPQKKVLFNDLPEGHIYVVFETFVRKAMNCNGYANSMRKWFEETPDKSFDSRFRQCGW